jgi:hypothetical protein
MGRMGARRCGWDEAKAGPMTSSRTQARGDTTCAERHTWCDWHLADDLVQTALAKLYVAWPRIHTDGAQDAYARRTIVRAYLSTSGGGRGGGSSSVSKASTTRRMKVVRLRTVTRC